MKGSWQALKDGFVTLKSNIPFSIVEKLRREHVIVDDEGYKSFSPKAYPELELCFEPLGEDENGDEIFRVCLYRNRVLLTEPVKVWIKKENN